MMAAALPQSALLEPERDIPLTQIPAELRRLTEEAAWHKSMFVVACDQRDRHHAAWSQEFTRANTAEDKLYAAEQARDDWRRIALENGTEVERLKRTPSPGVSFWRGEYEKVKRLLELIPDWKDQLAEVLESDDIAEDCHWCDHGIERKGLPGGYSYAEDCSTCFGIGRVAR